MLACNKKVHKNFSKDKVAFKSHLAPANLPNPSKPPPNI